MQFVDPDFRLPAGRQGRDDVSLDRFTDEFRFALLTSLMSEGFQLIAVAVGIASILWI